MSKFFPVKIANNRFNFFNNYIRKSSFAFLLKVIGAALNFGFNLVLANLLGAEGTGKYFLAFSVFTLTRLISLLGFQNAILKYISRAHELSDQKQLLDVLGRGVKYVLIASIICTLLIVLFSPHISEVFFNDLTLNQPIRIMALAIVPSSLILVFSQAFKGIGNYKASLFFEGIGVPLLGVIFLPILIFKWSVAGATLSMVIANFAILIIARFAIRKYLVGGLPFSGQSRISGFWKMSSSMLTIELLNYMLANGGVIILGIMIDRKSEVGIFAISQRLALLVSFILVAVNTVISPKISGLYAKGHIKDLKRLVQNSSLFLIIIAIPVLVVYLLFAGLLLGLFGDEFKEGTIVLSILAVGQFFHVAAGPVGLVLLMSGHEKIMMNNIIVSFVIVVTLFLLLIPIFGIEGAAISISVGLIMRNLVAIIFVNRIFGFHIFTLKLFTN